MNPEAAATRKRSLAVPAPRRDEPAPEAVAAASRAADQAAGEHLSWEIVTGLLEHNGIATAYQPLIDVRRHRVIGWEALLRAHHPQYGAISPVAVVEGAQEHGLLDLLTRRIIEDACATVHAVRGLVADPLTIHLNLELDQLAGDEPLLTWLTELGWPADVQVVAEITERGTDQWLAQYERGAALLSAGGIALAIDDCGAGSSRLGFLSARPWQVVKMDRQLMAGEEQRHVVVLRHLVELVTALGATSLAEGIETVEQLRMVRELGFDQAQGYLLGMPVPGPVMLTELARNGLELPPLP